MIDERSEFSRPDALGAWKAGLGSPYAALGLGVLFFSSYVDTVRGILLPVLNHTLGLSYSATSWFLVAGYAASVITTLWLDRFAVRLSTRGLTVGVLGATLAACLYAPWVHGYTTLLLLGAALGACVAGMSAVSNVLVIEGTDSKSRSRFLCALHMMYGLGSLVAPTAAAALLSTEWGGGWRGVLLICAPAFALMATTAARTLPMQVSIDPLPTDRARAPVSRAQAKILGLMAVYVVGEVILSSWMTTFLVEGQAFTVEQAAPYVSGFFLFMAGSRALCFLRMPKAREDTLMAASLAAGLTAFVAARAGLLWALPLCGLVGPFYPLMIARAAREFPDQVRSVNLRIVTSVQLALGLSHFLMGAQTDALGIRTTYWLPGVALATALLWLLIRRADGKETTGLPLD